MGRAKGIEHNSRITSIPRRSGSRRRPEQLPSYRHEGIHNGQPIEYWTTQPETSLQVAQEAELLHRSGGPAYIVRYPSGAIKARMFFRGGLLHREDGPAVEQLHENQSPLIEQWYLDGELHRSDGPAEISYDHLAAAEGREVVMDDTWWLRGQMLELLEDEELPPAA